MSLHEERCLGGGWGPCTCIYRESNTRTGARAVRSVTIRIDGRPPTPNARRHWRVTALDNETWKGAARISALAALPAVWEPLRRARATVTFIVPDRKARDLDNLIASTKPLTDGIVAAGVIADDSMDVLVSVAYGWEYRKGESATVYVLEEAA